MADSKTVSIVPLNEKNYPTWKVQCRLALLKEGLWSIVNETETAPEDAGEAHTKFLRRRDRATAIIGLSVDPSLLYLFGANLEDPVAMWKKLKEQFQKNTWANKLELRRKLFSLKLREGELVHTHVKAMTEVFDELAVIEAPVSDEDKVIHLLASLPTSYDMLVTALETNDTVPSIEKVTERLLHEEKKMREKETESEEDRRAFTAGHKRERKMQSTCYYCKLPGHFKRDCPKLAASQRKSELKGRHDRAKQSASKASATAVSSSSDEDGFLVSQALTVVSRGDWIVDSGATCHMSNDKELFRELNRLDKSQNVCLGDGHTLEATHFGTVGMEMLLPDGSTKKCVLRDVLYVPRMSYNLLSVSKATEYGKKVKFSKTGCEILNQDNQVIAFATRASSLYFLEFCRKPQVNSAQSENKERLWHRRFGHLSERNLQKLAKEKLVERFDYDATKGSIGFCEECVGGKIHRHHFEMSKSQTREPLELVHSDVCGKMKVKSIGGAQYFLTFTDDYSRYVWVYPLKTKDQVFSRFREWKVLIERSVGKKLKTLRTDNGGEFTSNEFESYLRAEGIRHECTIPKTPEQNGVAERQNHTLMESARSMLLDARLPHKFWAEAVSTAAYLRNRCPTSHVRGMTPYEALTGKKPKVEKLRVFGCDAFMHVPKDERSKFASKAKKCIMLGYGETKKGYRLFDPSRGKVVHSRDVEFNESKRNGDVPNGDVPNGDILSVDVPNGDVPSVDVPNGDVIFDGGSESEGDTNEKTTSEPVLRRSSRPRHRPDYYSELSCLAQSPSEPKTFHEAIASSESANWKEAMETEMRSLRDNDVWELVELPPGRKTVGSKWVYKVKTKADGSVERYKARLVAQGFTQQYGSDYDETFSPVVRLESLRTLIALSVQYGLKMHQVDVTTAFLNGHLREEVYMTQPKGFEQKHEQNLVCRLKKSLYGLKQSPRCWNNSLNSFLEEIGFVQSTSDPCIYMDTGGEMFLGVYVDDIILAGKSDVRIKEVKDLLGQKFVIKDMGSLHYFLGISVKQENGSVWIGQEAYIEKILEKFGMENCKAVSTPVEVSTKLTPAVNADECADQCLYQSAIGCLMYLSVSTRPDISFAVGSLARFTAKPTKTHWTALKRVFRYLRGTKSHGICYSTSGSTECVGYSDADWAGDTNDRKSTSGYLFQLSGGVVSWKSRKQSCVALSTAEAEYIALASAAQECVWLRSLTKELGRSTCTPTTLFEDNQSTMAMAKNPQYHGRTKHVDIKYHFIREQIENGTIELKYCPTTQMIADILTKGLNQDQFCKLRTLAGIVEPP